MISAHRKVAAGFALADGEFDSERNHLFRRELLHANSVIPAIRFTDLTLWDKL